MTDLNKRAWDGIYNYQEQNYMSGGTVMTHQTNEEFKTKLYKIMSKDLVLSAKTHIEVLNAIDEIMSLIPQPEQKDHKNEN